MSRPRYLQEVIDAAQAVARERGKRVMQEAGFESDAQSAGAVERRGPGRPRRSLEGFFLEYRRAWHHCGPDATDKELAKEFGVSEQWFSRLVSRFGRPK